MFKLILAISMALILAGCQSDSVSLPDESQGSSPKKIGSDSEDSDPGLFSSVFNKSQPKSIVLPPDLISSANQKVKQNHDQANEDRRNQVLPEVIGATVINQDGERWLQVESNPKAVWNALADFWAEVQVELVEYEPAAGLMETDWIVTGTESGRSEDAGVVRKMFDKVVGAGTSFDKYKIRLEREAGELTNVYVSHRSTEKLESNFNSRKKITEWAWVAGDSNPEKVAQLLQIMVLIFDSSARDSA